MTRHSSELLVAAILVALGTLACHSRPAAGGPRGEPIVEARREFASHRMAAATAEYRRALEGPADAATRREAGRRLAAIEWRVERDDEAAAAVLRQLETVEGGAVASALERARWRTARGDFAAARAAADAAMAGGGRGEERREALLAWTEAAVEEALADRLAGRPFVAGEGEPLARARTALAELVTESPGELPPARQLVLAGALLGDGPAVLAGWRSYYLLLLRDPGALALPRGTLEAVLPGLAGAADAERLRVVDALALSAFPDAAAALALARGPSGGALADAEPRAREIVAYARTLRDIRELTDEHYRLTALGQGSGRRWRRRLMASAEALWPNLAWSGTAARFTPDRLESELEARFGTVFTAGDTAGYPSLHMGHRVVDERRRVEQYGCTAEVRFLALDGMVSNGFQTWAWDGDAGTGGWGEAELIVQVRPGYADDPLRAWRKLTDPEPRARVEQQITGSQAADLAIAATRTVAYLPGLVARLSRDAEAALRDELAARGLAGAALREAFLQEHGRAVEEASIFAHEGRHAIDNRLDSGFSGEELEYRAKLSELAFAPRPFLLLPSILGANLGDSSAHGAANARVALALVEWMRRHAAEIAGLSASAPLLPQVGLLTPEQLRAAVREADPLARAGGCRPE